MEATSARKFRIACYPYFFAVYGGMKMPKSIYEIIYRDLKQKIETNIFTYQELLPSENTLIQTYHCSRNTLRRAIGRLVTDGYVQTIQGKGVRNIYQPAAQTAFTIGEIETFGESAVRNGRTPRTEVLLFTEFSIHEKQALHTGFPTGSEIYYIQRLHYLDDMPLILNHNYFLKEAVPGLTAEIAEDSIYRYLENTLHMTIVNSKRIMTVEKMTQIDEKYLKVNAEEYNCMAVVSSQTYNSDGIMFEYTQSRHRPDYFRFYDNAVRRNASLRK
jgi:GntR family trehalose operon transcriptional repressor